MMLGPGPGLNLAVEPRRHRQIKCRKASERCEGQKCALKLLRTELPTAREVLPGCPAEADVIRGKAVGAAEATHENILSGPGAEASLAHEASASVRIAFSRQGVEVEGTLRDTLREPFYIFRFPA